MGILDAARGYAQRGMGGLSDILADAYGRAEYYIPPELRSPLRALPQALEFSDAADWRDYYTHGTDATNALAAGDYRGAAGAGLGALIAGAGAMVPGLGVGRADNVLRAAADGRRGAASPADEVAALLREGRGSEVTDEMLARFTPQDEARLFELYEQGATGMDLPMDAASRAARAEGMGFDAGRPLSHGTWENKEFSEFAPSERGKIGPGVYLTDDYRLSNKYAGIGHGDEEFMINNHRPRNIPVVAPRELAGGDPRSMAARQNARDVAGSYDTNAEGYASVLDAYGYGGTNVENQVSIPDPSRIRSRFARFDPRLSHLRNLSAAGLGVAVGANALRDYGYDDEGNPQPGIAR